jgi:hypothetical protein
MRPSYSLLTFKPSSSIRHCFYEDRKKKNGEVRKRGNILKYKRR